MGEFRTLATYMGFTLIIIFGVVTFFSSGVSEYGVTNNLNLTGLEKYEAFNDQIDTSTASVTENSDINIDAGSIIWQGGISFIKGIISGQWLGLFTGLFTESFALAGVNATQIVLFIGVVILIIIMIVISMFISREV